MSDQKYEERHSFINTGISREAFQDIAVRATNENPALRWFLHAHPHDPYQMPPCNHRCQVVHQGAVERVEIVTQMDAASSSNGM